MTRRRQRWTPPRSIIGTLPLGPPRRGDRDMTGDLERGIGKRVNGRHQQSDISNRDISNRTQPRGRRRQGDNMQTTVGQQAALIEGAVEGDETIAIRGISSIEDAQDGDITFAETDKLLSSAGRSRRIGGDRSGEQPEAGRGAGEQAADPCQKPSLRVCPGAADFCAGAEGLSRHSSDRYYWRECLVRPQCVGSRPGCDRRQCDTRPQLRGVPVCVPRRQCLGRRQLRDLSPCGAARRHGDWQRRGHSQRQRAGDRRFRLYVY